MRINFNGGHLQGGGEVKNERSGETKTWQKAAAQMGGREAGDRGERVMNF